MNARAARNKNKRLKSDSVLRGMATIAIGQDMGNHRIISDEAAMRLDAMLLRRDYECAWHELIGGHEADAA